MPQYFSSKLFKTVCLLICTLSLSGCDAEMYESQIPVLGEFTSKTPETIYDQAVLARRARKYNTAIRIFTAFIRLYSDPKHQYIEDAYSQLIHCYEARGQRQDAIQTINTFISLYPDSVMCIELEQKKKRLQRKQIMDTAYFLAWRQDIRNRHETNYLGLVEVVDRLSDVQ
jgi:tetratricopeptide (TPR) repeat protein